MLDQGITTALWGARRPDQLQPVDEVTGWQLDASAKAEIDRILRENYQSVVAMVGLNEALERIDSSCQFTLAGREQEARQEYLANWERYDAALGKEAANLTIHPREDDLVAQLQELSRHYRQKGDAFFASGQKKNHDDLVALLRQEINDYLEGDVDLGDFHWT